MQPVRENLLHPDRPARSPQGWEHWFLRVTRKAIKADYLVHHDTPSAARANGHTSYTPPAARRNIPSQLAGNTATQRERA